MLVNMSDILKDAKEKCYAVPQFNINNLEWIKYILEECNKENCPVILGASLSAIKYMGGYKNVYSMVTNLIDNLNINIPVSLHLDHGKSIEDVKKAIDAGFTSVMLDYSSKSLAENIEATNQIIEYAHAHNVIVEGEIGQIGTSGYASFDECILYNQKTDVDLFAPAIGNVHGIYHEEPNLQFELVKKLKENLNTPLVLHGGSLIGDENIKKLIKLGITKININTELQIAWKEGLEEGLKNNPDVYDPRKIISFGEEKLKEMVYNKIKLFRTYEQ